MDLQRYDIIKAKIKYQGEGSVQTKERPYVIVSNPIGTKRATIITVMPLTSKIQICQCMDVLKPMEKMDCNYIQW